MKELIELIQQTVDVPLCIDSSVPGALEAGLMACEGRPLLNSVTGEEDRLELVLPLVKKYNVPVVAISNDDTGISEDPDVRFAVAKKIVERAADFGIPAHDIVVDPLVMPVGAMGTRRSAGLHPRPPPARRAWASTPPAARRTSPSACRTATASTRPSCRWRSARA